MTFIKGHDDPVYPVNSCYTQIFEWQTKILCLLQFFPEVAQNSLSFPRSEKSLSIPRFPGLWPPCLMHTLGFCLTHPFLRSYSRLGYFRLGQSPKVYWELLWQNFCRTEALQTSLTGVKSNQMSVQCTTARPQFWTTQKTQKKTEWADKYQGRRQKYVLGRYEIFGEV